MTDFQRDDRARVADELARAKAEGRLTDAEYEERLRYVAAATSYTELAALTADLPGDAPTAPPRRSRKRRSKKRRYVVYVLVTGVNFLVWGILSLSLGFVLYPWWVWVALFWGLLVLIAP
ncbi:fatty acid desaturase [Saccharothrix tamanrassetensis]|uniref:Fatty acid desaturase n=1 Tax=Saccharothrix tamanrassetensis TaxID=1051531 RepID=A0A841CBT7_9PSEU|nr:DUF1707 domain-containing protein [Saccharothrix tamanrassetensis]MBB5954869.1 fatty acid desaturase [Saccharothrix tamanrassetensis]